MNRLTAIWTILLIAVGSEPVRAATVESTPLGGSWSVGSTWVGGAVPGPGDDVVVWGPVTVPGTATCANLTVAAAGRVSNGVVTPGTLAITGDLANAGIIENGTQLFDVRLGGDLTNDGNVRNRRLILTGAADHHLMQAASALFDTELHQDAASGDLFIDTPFVTDANVELVGMRIVLGPDCPLTLRQAAFSGDLVCAGNEVRFESFATLVQGTMDQAVLVGDVRATSGFSFTGGLTVRDYLTHVPGGSHLFVEGTLINLGSIVNENYGLTIALDGDLECHGLIANSFIELDGAVERRLRMGPGGDLAAPLFLPEFGTGSLVVETDALVTEGIALGMFGSMTLEPGITLTLDGGSISGGTLWANGNVIPMSANATLNLDRVDRAILEGVAQAGNGAVFTGGLTVLGTLQNWEFAPSDVRVEGDLWNHGTIRDNVQTLALRVTGNVVNLGSFTNRRIVLEGSEDQLVEIGGGIETQEFVLTAEFTSGAYQWYRDGALILGATGSSFTLGGVALEDAGTYRCEGAEGQVSRAMVLGEGLVAGVGDDGDDADVTSPTGDLPTIAALQPHPVSRRAAGIAEVAFFLPAAAEVRSSLFDVGGREVAFLGSGPRNAGLHRVEIPVGGLRPGVYFLRIATPAGEATRKLAIVE